MVNPQWAPEWPAVGVVPRLSDAELVTWAVLQVLLGFDSGARLVSCAKALLRAWFANLPERSGYDKRLRAAVSFCTM